LIGILNIRLALARRSSFRFSEPAAGPSGSLRKSTALPFRGFPRKSAGTTGCGGGGRGGRGLRREEGKRERERAKNGKKQNNTARSPGLVLLNAKQLSCDKGRTAAPRRGERILGSACSSRSAGDE